MDFSRGITAYGDPRDPCVVFLHGVRLGAKIWEPHARSLCREFFVVTPDLPGHGALADLPFEASLCDALLSRIAADLPRPPLIVGYSLGGYVAMRYALARSENTAGLLLTGCSTDIIGMRAAIYEVAVGLAAQIPEAAMQRILAFLLRVTLPPRVADVVVPFGFNQRVFEQSRSVATGVEYSRELARYENPVLIVNGEWDVLFRPDEAKYAAGPRRELRILSGSDHVAPLRRPVEFAGIVGAFARKVLRAQGATVSGPMS